MHLTDGALTAILVAVVILLVILVIAVFPHKSKPGPGTVVPACAGADGDPQALTDAAIYAGLEDAIDWKGKPSVDPSSKASPHDPKKAAPPVAAPGGARSRFTASGGAPGGAGPLYQAEDVDSLVLGQLATKTRQFSPTGDRLDGGRPADGTQCCGEPGCASTPGVDTGPLGPSEVYADGIPPQWAMPSTPVVSNLGGPGKGDVYDPVTNNGSVDSVGLHALYVPDHDPLFN